MISKNEPILEDGAWRRYLFETLSPSQLSSFSLSLHLFRFCRVYGGHNNDGDQLILCFNFYDEEDLISILGKMGIRIEETPQNAPRAQVFNIN